MGRNRSQRRKKARAKKVMMVRQGRSPRVSAKKNLTAKMRNKSVRNPDILQRRRLNPLKREQSEGSLRLQKRKRNLKEMPLILMKRTILLQRRDRPRNKRVRMKIQPRRRKRRRRKRLLLKRKVKVRRRDTRVRSIRRRRSTRNTRRVRNTRSRRRAREMMTAVASPTRSLRGS